MFKKFYNFRVEYQESSIICLRSFATSGSSIKSQVLDLKTFLIFSPLKISVSIFEYLSELTVMSGKGKQPARKKAETSDKRLNRGTESTEYLTVQRLSVSVERKCPLASSPLGSDRPHSSWRTLCISRIFCAGRDIQANYKVP